MFYGQDAFHSFFPSICLCTMIRSTFWQVHFKRAISHITRKKKHYLNMVAAYYFSVFPSRNGVLKNIFFFFKSHVTFKVFFILMSAAERSNRFMGLNEMRATNEWLLLSSVPIPASTIWKYSPSNRSRVLRGIEHCILYLTATFSILSEFHKLILVEQSAHLAWKKWEMQQLRNDHSVLTV